MPFKQLYCPDSEFISNFKDLNDELYTFDMLLYFIDNGFLNKWHALIPVDPKNDECIGVCFVQFNGDGKIHRNEVYFDTKELISEIEKYNNE